MITRLTAMLRNHLLFFTVVPPLIILMTWPIALQIVDASANWLPATNYDIWMKFWDAWYGGKIFRGGADFYFTDLLFYPQGLSLVYHNFNVPHMLVFDALQQIMPPIAAYCFTHLLIILVDICAAYLYLCYLLRDKLPALVGAAVFGLAPFVLNQPEHPDIILVAALPLTLYFFERGIQEGRWKWNVIAGVCAGITVFTGMYIFICLLLTVALRLAILARTASPAPGFWLRLLLLCGLVGSIGMVRVLPMIQDRDSLDDALDKSRGWERNHDLLALVVHPGHSLTEAVFDNLFDRPVPKVDDFGYLGFLPLLLVAFGFTRADTRRKMLPWLFVMLPFLLLRLGSFLTIDGRTIESVPLPKYYLGKLIPVIFEAFWEVSNFHIGIQLPLAILTALGLAALLNGLSGRVRLVLVAAVLIWLAYEYYRPPNQLAIPDVPPAFNSWLNQEEGARQIYLVNLPMRRAYSKLYGFYQTYNGYPHVDGLASRTPSAAFTYIDSNSLLSTWRAGAVAVCLPVNRDQYIADLERLLADGFSHVILHKWLPGANAVSYSFANVPVAYQDAYVLIYRLDDLRAQCDTNALLNFEPSGADLSLLTRRVAWPDHGAVILSLHSDSQSNEALSRYYQSALQAPRHLRPLMVGDLARGVETPLLFAEDDLAVALADTSIVLLAHEAEGANPEELAVYQAWMGSRWQSCGEFRESDNLVVELYRRPDLPCELTVADKLFAVDYDNGIQLGNLVLAQAGDSLDLHFIWSTLPQATHSISIQFFDDSGLKAHGQDFVIGLEPLARQVVDLSPLPPGDYQAKMIVYDYVTRASVSGRLLHDQAAFQRELDIAGLRIE